MKFSVLYASILAVSASSQPVATYTDGATVLKAVGAELKGALMEASTTSSEQSIVDDSRALVPDHVPEGAIGKEDQLLEKRKGPKCQFMSWLWNYCGDCDPLKNPSV